MNEVLQQMIERYNPKNNIQRENAIKEIFQEIALSGLSHSDFFKKVAFYGGTCLRIYYGLDRFSEDLDFALIDKSSFNLEDYFPYIVKEFNSYGIDVELKYKNKSADSMVESAFINSNTLTLLLDFFPNNQETRNILFNQTIKIKFEVDIDNPEGGKFEYKYRLLPSPFEVKVFDEPSLFAGKLSAILSRKYENNVKGRDYYDYLFYISKGSKINVSYLENKLKKSNIINKDETLTLDKIKELLKNKFESVNYNLAINDVQRFINDVDKVRIWKKELFISTLDNLKK